MGIVATPLRNKYDHISYLLVCDDSGDALALDPFDVELTLRIAGERKLAITQILSTHEHWDHAGRNEQLRAATGARVLASKWAAGVIEHLDGYLTEGDVVTVGTTMSLEVIETPGHTMTHISLLGSDNGQPFLLSGDTLFGAGVGNCGYGGHAPTLYRTVQKLQSRLPLETRIHPGHDYLRRNLDFALSLEPSNGATRELRAELEREPEQLRFTDLATELEINPFMRLDSAEIRESVKVNGSGDEETFLAIRSLRDNY